MSQNTTPEEESFSVIEASSDGLPAIIVVNEALRPETERARYPWLVTITLPLDEPNEMGLCDERESERLGEIEDRLLEHLKPQGYRYFYRITWNGFRDVLLYVADAEDALKRLTQGLKEAEEPAVTLERTHDPDWHEYFQFFA